MEASSGSRQTAKKSLVPLASWYSGGVLVGVGVVEEGRTWEVAASWGISVGSLAMGCYLESPSPIRGVEGFQSP